MFEPADSDGEELSIISDADFLLNSAANGLLGVFEYSQNHMAVHKPVYLALSALNSLALNAFGFVLPR